MNRPRIAARVFAGGTAAAAAALILAPAIASAAPTDPVPGTECNVGQVERATEVIAPEAFVALDQMPGGHATAEKFITATPEQRDAQLVELQEENPLAAAYYKANKEDIDAKIAKVIADCHQY